MSTDPRDRDVAAFDRRAADYDRGGLGAWHQLIARRAADIALAARPQPGTVLDVGCGTGALLTELAARVQGARLLAVDPARGMTALSRDRLSDATTPAIVAQAMAERLPLGDGTVDLALSTMSFDHWRDQRAGIRELARVLRPGGRVVLVDLCARWLPQRDGRARRPAAVAALLVDAGLRIAQRHDVYRLAGVLPLVRAHVAAP
jgi:ubiquinone/menaquinone biosynthesis C-methylase UbiE